MVGPHFIISIARGNNALTANAEKKPKQRVSRLMFTGQLPCSDDNGGKNTGRDLI